jgi:hypothetical protein
MQTLNKSVDEALRVLRPDKELRFGPFLDKNGRTMSDVEIINQYCLLQSLRSRKDLEFWVRGPQNGWVFDSFAYMGMLTVLKKG